MRKDAAYSLFVEDMEQVREVLAPFVNLLERKNIFLTGCTAFMGKWLIDSLLWLNEKQRLGIQLFVLVRNKEKFLTQMPHLAQRKHMTFVEGSILDFDADALPSFDLAIQGVNLANDGTENWAARHMTVATQGMEILYRLAASKGCKAILLASSGAVYGTGVLGEQEQGLLREEAEREASYAEPRVYGETKRFLELYSSALGEQYSIRTAIARCFAFCGAHMPLGPNALGSFVADALAGKDIKIKGDGTPVRSFLYGADMSAWLLTLLVRGRHGVPYNVGSRSGVSLAELAHRVLQCAESDAQVCIAGKNLQGNAPSQYVPDTSRICKELALQERISLDEGIRCMLAWYGA